MVGGGSRKDGPIAINSTNVFAALGSLKKKKKLDKAKNKQDDEGNGEKEQVFWAPAPLTMKSWADVDDDDYYATTAPPLAVWGGGDEKDGLKGNETPVEESESEDEGLDETDDEETPEIPYEEEAIVEVLPPKETDRQLSKKELKKKELAELQAVLAELGINETTSKETSCDSAQENQNEGTEKTVGPSETKSAKKKKKEKSVKDTIKVAENSVTEEKEGEKSEQVLSGGVNMKEKMASMTKKKSGKELDGAARSAASEAAARTARLAAAKKKEKNHYNQQPVRESRKWFRPDRTNEARNRTEDQTRCSEPNRTEDRTNDARNQTGPRTEPTMLRTESDRGPNQ